MAYCELTKKEIFPTQWSQRAKDLNNRQHIYPEKGSWNQADDLFDDYQKAFQQKYQKPGPRESIQERIKSFFSFSVEHLLIVFNVF